MNKNQSSLPWNLNKPLGIEPIAWPFTPSSLIATGVSIATRCRSFHSLEHDETSPKYIISELFKSMILSVEKLSKYSKRLRASRLLSRYGCIKAGSRLLMWPLQQLKSLKTIILNVLVAAWNSATSHPLAVSNENVKTSAAEYTIHGREFNTNQRW